jgi:hypothetical protein
LSSQELIYVQKLIPLIQGLEMQWDRELKEADGKCRGRLNRDF